MFQLNRFAEDYSLIQGVSKVRSDFYSLKCYYLLKKAFCKTWYVIHYSSNIE